jgi:hypothetical protein
LHGPRLSKIRRAVLKCGQASSDWGARTRAAERGKGWVVGRSNGHNLRTMPPKHASRLVRKLLPVTNQKGDDDGSETAPVHLGASGNNHALESISVVRLPENPQAP